MNLLAIDTSTKNLSLSIAKDGKVVKFRNIKLNRPLSFSIMPSIKKILDSSGITLEKLDGFAVGLGPGSFTSLRVGLSTIKGLAFASNKPVVGISSLDVLAMNIEGDHRQICTLCDAKRNLLYSCLYEKNGSVLKKKNDYVLENIDEVTKKLKGEVIFIGDGIKLFREDINKVSSINPTFVDGKLAYPQARHLLPLALEKFKNNVEDDIAKLVPLYLYPEHCQVRNQAKKSYEKK